MVAQLDFAVALSGGGGGGGGGHRMVPAELEAALADNRRSEMVNFTRVLSTLIFRS